MPPIPRRHRVTILSAAATVGAAALTSALSPLQNFVAPHPKIVQTTVAVPRAFLPPLAPSRSSALFAKPNKAAALAGLDQFDDIQEVTLSKKELKAQEKQRAKEEKKAQAKANKKNKNGADAQETDGDGDSETHAPPAAPAVDIFADADEPLSLKEQMALEKKNKKKASQQAQQPAADIFAEADAPLSKKEQKALEKKLEKEAKKAKAKADKKNKKKGTSADEEVEAADDGAQPAAVGEAPEEEKKKMTLEDKIRKERPPPRVRIMEGVQPGFVSLALENVGVTFKNQEVIKSVSWGVTTGDRIGLVGPNGGGKTTQVRILAGELEPTVGDVLKSTKDLRVAMLRQEFADELVLTRSLVDEFLSVFEEENKILADLRKTETDLEGAGSLEDPDAMQAILDRMESLQTRADDKGVYQIRARAEKAMDLMGFTAEERVQPVSSFSGGWKMRIGLGKVLCRDPNVLLLDEPTNHLDLDSVEWLEAFLREQNIPMVIVSHDREFLDQVCNKIIDTEGGLATKYDGNYSRFLQLKKARLDAWKTKYDNQEKKIKEEKSWIQKFKVKQPEAVKQRAAKLEKMQKSKDYVQKPPFVGKPFKFRFPDAPRLGAEVAEVRGLKHGYDGDLLFEDVELDVQKNERVAIIGPNGSGKSTLLRILVGQEEPHEGNASILGSNVVLNYFEQNQADSLDLEKTVEDTVAAASSNQSYNELRALMGQFLFKGDTVKKKVANLSGGEKARLTLCCMMLRPANLLILDEPTNHLDIPAKEMLEEALQYFLGSVVLISHDRYFVSKVANSICAIESKRVERYSGDYRYYMEKSAEWKAKVEARYVNGVERIEAAPKINIEEDEKKKVRNFGGAKTANLVTRKDKGIKNAKRNESS
mmetsp:Transcript_6374/g.13355  ORF Transcript_6374/g.13355 Transcript_6374/m.13355 type:complete len:877 (-) Transcript_6374:43-2673(-)